MENLVESLLALARGDEGAPLDPRPDYLGALTSEAVEAARATAEGKVAVEYEPPRARSSSPSTVRLAL